MTPTPHERLASAIEARRGDLGLSLREVADLAGITSETLRAVRKGSNEPSPMTKRGIERAMQWAPGSVDAILAGDEPTSLVGALAAARTPQNDADEKLQRATQLLAEGMALLEEVRRERRKGA